MTAEPLALLHDFGLFKFVILWVLGYFVIRHLEGEIPKHPISRLIRSVRIIPAGYRLH
jgi:hypothetical protein